jgi:hypothetical protein
MQANVPVRLKQMLSERATADGEIIRELIS